MKIKKTWAEKLHSGQKPQVKLVDFDFSDIPAGSLMFIATPEIVDTYIKHIPKGRFVEVKTLRKDLALEHHAEYTCPLTTGIFLRIVAEANYEKFQRTKSWKDITPFWRVIEPKSPLAKKLTCGTEFIEEQRKKERNI